MFTHAHTHMLTLVEFTKMKDELPEAYKKTTLTDEPSDAQEPSAEKPAVVSAYSHSD